MNGRVSKRLRRQVYGKGFAPLEERKYATNSAGTAVVNTGLRAKYLKVKRKYKKGGVSKCSTGD